LFLFSLILPIQSLATPTITINGISALGTSTACPSATYNQCWNLLTGPYGNWNLTSAPTGTPKLLVGDFTTTDLMTLTGGAFQPISTNTGTTTATIIFSNTFNFLSTQSSSSYLYALQIGGYFQAGTGGNVGDLVSYSAVGTFSSAGSQAIGTALTNPAIGASSTINYFGGSTPTLSQSQAYPLFSNCNNLTANCEPTITHTLSFTVTGRDSAILTNSVDSAGGPCDESGIGYGGQPCTGPASLTTIVQTFLDDAAAADAAAVPEPASLLLLGSGLAGLAAFGSFRRRRQAL
jgi:hypothetical protein